MKIQSITIGMQVRHPQYGVGLIRGISEHTVDVVFDDGKRIVDPEAAELEAAEPQVAVTGLERPLSPFIEEIVARTVAAIGLEKPDPSPVELLPRWQNGKIVIHSSDPSLQTKEIPLETFFHKIVMVRNQLRVLEQKINAHEKLSDAEKVDMQQYITRSYGSLTTFNLLFRSKESHFGA